MDPAGVIGRKSAGRNGAMHMWMEQQILTPGVQDTEKADFCSQVLGVSGNLQECGCASLKQQAIEDFWIVLAKGIQLMWDGEYHMEVGHAEHFFFAGGEPALARLRLALWAMPIAACNGVHSITCLMGSFLFWGV